MITFPVRRMNDVSGYILDAKNNEIFISDINELGTELEALRKENGAYREMGGSEFMNTIRELEELKTSYHNVKQMHRIAVEQKRTITLLERLIRLNTRI
jgi:hypothetical protein